MKTVALLSLVHTLRKWKATDPTLGIQCRRAHEERAVENSSLTVPQKKRKKKKPETLGVGKSHRTLMGEKNGTISTSEVWNQTDINIRIWSEDEE